MTAAQLLLAVALFVASPAWAKPPACVTPTLTPPPCGKGPVTIVVAYSDWCPVPTPTRLPRVRDGQVYRVATPVPTPKGKAAPECSVFGVRLAQCLEPCERTRQERWSDWPECGGEMLSGDWP